MTDLTETFRRHWPMTWRIDAAETARERGADRVAWVLGPGGGDRYAFERWAGWAEIVFDANPPINAASALATALGRAEVDRDQALAGLDLEVVFLRPGQPVPTSAIDVDRVVDLLPV